MKYLVTGGRGVIGSLFARRLIAEGHSVAIIDDGDDPRHRANSLPGPVYHQRRLEHMRTDELARVIGECDRVFHAAASTGIPYSAENPLDDWRRNVDGTLSLLEALRVEPRPTVVLSSVKPYTTDGVAIHRPVNESRLLEADEPYSASKAAQSFICQAYARSYKIPIVVFRCSNLYGPACCHGPRHGWLTWFAIQSALGWWIEIQGGGKQERDMLHASDVGEAALLAFQKMGSLFGDIFNLGGGSDNMIGVREAYEELQSFGSTSIWRDGPARDHEDALFCTDTGAFRAATDWRPVVSVKRGLREVYDWAVANREMLTEVYGGER